MNILEQIKKDNVDAIKSRDSEARAIFGVVMNKALLQSVEKRAKGEELSDIDMVAILQKTVKELGDECENYKKAGNAKQVTVIERQTEIVKKYLPQMMSEGEILKIINTLSDKSLPNVMKHFRLNFAGKVDMGLVQKVIKNIQ
ncbi:MAG: GatB/YqeY domain-containing protein [Christensenellaceae bacterium]|jgi:uncharacterized protein YqeY|nr:GatB/YqeY domain-containing protein [Christensenellaceae bacterium]